MGFGVVSASPRTWNLVAGFLLLARTIKADGLAISYCSPDLTSGGFQSVFNQYQTNGACRDVCAASYAFAVVRGQLCWCSNYIPSQQVSTYDCNTQCPGYGTEWCGNEAKGYYGYYAMDGKAPSGTAGGSSTATSGSSVSNTPSSTGSPPATSSTIPPPPLPSSSSSSSSSGGSSSLTVIPSIQSSSRTSLSSSRPAVVSSSSASVVVSEPVTSSTSSGPSTTITRAAATPTEVYTSITTVTGQIRTVIVTPTPSSDSTLGSGTSINSSGGGGVSTGKVVGIVIGVALGLGLLIGFGVWLWLRRRHQRNMEAASLDSSYAPTSNNIPSRQVSQLSSAGLLGKAPRILTSGLPSSNNPRSADTLGSNVDRRSLGTDQRLNPYAIYAHDESRHSNVSLQDNQDYSRQLRVANPDP